MRVATWNLLHGLDIRTGRIDLGAVAAAIDALDVDVLAVQEVVREQRRSGAVDQVADLASSSPPRTCPTSSGAACDSCATQRPGQRPAACPRC